MNCVSSAVRGIFLIIRIVVTLALPCRGFSATFANQFVEFSLPNNWSCALEGAEWVCQSKEDPKKRDAIIVLAAKLKGDQDTLDKYQDYLSKARVFSAPNGKGISSQPKYAKMTELNAQPWVDALHLESEIPGFFTRYLATIKSDIGVLVTYSIDRNKYLEYQPQFEEMVKSMKVFRKAGAGINSNPNASLFNTAQLPGSFTRDGVFSNAGASPDPKAKKPTTEEDNPMLLIGVVGAILVAFVIYKKKKSGG